MLLLYSMLEDNLIVTGKIESLQDGIFICSGLNQCFVGEVIAFGNVLSELRGIVMDITQSFVKVVHFPIALFFMLLFFVLFFRSSSFNTTTTSAGVGAGAGAGAGGTSSSPEDDDDSWGKWFRKHYMKIIIGIVVVGLVVYIYKDNICSSLHTLNEYMFPRTADPHNQITQGTSVPQGTDVPQSANVPPSPPSAPPTPKPVTANVLHELTRYLRDTHRQAARVYFGGADWTDNLLRRIHVFVDYANKLIGAPDAVNSIRTGKYTIYNKELIKTFDTWNNVRKASEVRLRSDFMGVGVNPNKIRFV